MGHTDNRNLYILFIYWYVYNVTRINNDIHVDNVGLNKFKLQYTIIINYYTYIQRFSWNPTQCNLIEIFEPVLHKKLTVNY